MRALFMAGTDTGVGKTHVAVALVRALRAAGIDAVGMKPVASGCVPTPGGWRNDDALALLAAGGLPAGDYALVNPVALPRPQSPHLAACAQGVTVDPDPVLRGFSRLQARHGFVVVEGVGGWSVPLAGPRPRWLMQADLVRMLGLPVLLVVGLRLGCINHALLAARAIIDDGLPLAGWVANVLDPRDDQDGVIATLQALLPAPLLGLVAQGGGADAALVRAVLGVV